MCKSITTLFIFLQKFLQRSQSHGSIFGRVRRSLRAFIVRRVVHVAVVHSGIHDGRRVARVGFRIGPLRLRETVAKRRALAVGWNLVCDAVEWWRHRPAGIELHCHRVFVVGIFNGCIFILFFKLDQFYKIILVL